MGLVYEHKYVAKYQNSAKNSVACIIFLYFKRAFSGFGDGGELSPFICSYGLISKIPARVYDENFLFLIFTSRREY